MVFSSLCEKLFSLHCMCIKRRLSSFCIPVLTVEDLRWQFAPEGGETAPPLPGTGAQKLIGAK